MADIDRVEMLMQLGENLRNDNNEWRKAVWKEGQERARRVSEMLARFEKEYAALAQEHDLLAQYLPRQEPMPRAVTKGPADEPVQRQVNK